MTRPADAKKTASTLAPFALVGAVAAVALWYFIAPAGAPRVRAQPAAHAASAAAVMPRAGGAPLGPVSSLPALPASLEGTMPPRLPVDAHGHLRKTRAVREFFDYFLTAQHEMRDEALDALVRKQIASQLDATLAQRDALDVWQRYGAYRRALAELAPLAAPSPARGLDLDALQSSLDEHVSLAGRTLGADWSEAFFGLDWRRGRYTIERLRIARDPALTEAQKAARLRALDESMPPEARASRADGERARATVDTVAKLEQQGGSIDALRANATQALGPQAAERIVKMQQDDDAWRAKYADYAAQRARIDAMGLTSAERDARIDQLRRQAFSNPADAIRAASLDGPPAP
ncbi:lipase secretion chaperone [Trinickia sp.]|uniref:lipase secretion chaperone n=1 Tax=Trinickia sp. TaxID=2571163 RepID=UPI003F808747